MEYVLPSQISSSEHVTEDEKEPIVFIDGVPKENGSYGHEFLGIRDSKVQQVAHLLSPLTWFRVLSNETHWSFVFGVVVVYGISQGFGGGTWKVAIEYYWKDVQKVQPSAAQFYQGIISIPWIVKPLWGLLTDVLPMAGYRRKPYFIFAGLLGVFSMLTLSLHSKLHVVFALLAMTAGSASVAIADVTIDACVAQNSIAKPSLAADMQSLCGLSASIGALIGFSLSGILVHVMGSQAVIGLLSIPCLLTVSVGILIKEPHTNSFAYNEVHKKFLQVGQSMWSTLKCPQVWRPCVYMYITLALSLNIQEGMFYWYTNPKAGPAFSQETVGFIFSIGSIGSLLGVLLYQNLLKDFQFRSMLFWVQLLTSFVGMLDLVLVLRLNLKLGIPDYFFVVVDECVSQLIGRIKWMPLLVLSSKLCPSGIEGTFFALLMSIDNVGLLSSSWGGGLLLRLLNVTRTKFGNLWTAILIRNIMRLLPLSLLFLVPKSNQNSNILPPEMLMENESSTILKKQMLNWHLWSTAPSGVYLFLEQMKSFVEYNWYELLM
ncbi:putative folate-biopterin transporter 2 [Dendrobium catenatum]|uniref:Putative folate-biopterin transporter 2 n=1 Tax=Dendrobium catenatum TaxID=906689 RepID=A0A2I0V7U7_9ASPA|nr:putative folate-biopterin transporter 2 [Dendrobium catenatum]